MKKQIDFFVFTIFFLMPFLCVAQNYEDFNHSIYGGLGSDYPQELIPDGDEYMLVGQVSAGANLGGEYYGNYYDLLVVRLDQNGEIIWSENYGGSDMDVGFSIAKTTNGFVIGGYTRSNDGQVVDDTPGYDSDGWLMKISDTGEMLWNKTFGTPGLKFDDEFFDVIVLDDGSIVACGRSDGFLNGFNGKIIKTDPDGNLIWEHSYGGSQIDSFSSLVQTNDGGFLLAGTSESSDVDVEENNGSYDVWIVKTDSEGNIEWEDNYGGSEIDQALSIKQTTGGNFVVAGNTSSNDGDVSVLNGNADIWLLWLDEEGFLIQEVTYGNEGVNGVRDVVRNQADNGWLVTGYTQNQLSEESGIDAWVFEASDDEGQQTWSVISGGSGGDVARNLVINENDFLVTGHTSSEDGDLEPFTSFGADDLWIFDIVLVFNTAEVDGSALKVFPNPAASEVYFDSINTLSEISLYSLNGVLLKTVENQNKIDVSKLAAGVYFLRLKTDNLIVKRKLVVE